MSTKSTAPAPARGAKKSATPIGLPQVNLLPPEVRKARALVAAKRWMVLALGAVVLLLVAGYGWAVLMRGAAQGRLDDAAARTVTLQTEEAKYAEVPQVLGALSQAEQARQAGMASEILWKPYLDAITTVLPTGVSIDSFTLTGPSPVDAATVAADPLAVAGIGSVTFEARSLTVPNTADWVDALAAVPGFASPWVSSTATAEEEGTTYYTVSMTVQLTDATLAGRFAATDGEG